MYPRGAERPDRRPWSSPRRSRSRAGRRTRPTSSRSSSGTRACPGSARRRRSTRYDESAESALAYLEAVADELGDDPFALEEMMQRLPAEQFAARAAIDAALHDLCGKLVGVPVWRLLGLARSGPPTSWTIWLGDPDDMARRAERADASGRFRRLKLKLGGARRARRRARARGARRHRRAAPGRRQRVLVARRGARGAAAAATSSASSTASSRCAAGDADGREAEAALADPDLRRRGLPHARRRRRAARESRTGSTSSSRSRAGSARRCGWRTPRARSGSA